MKFIAITIDWIQGNYGWIISLFIQGFIAYHVFFLSKKLTSKARLEHKEKIKKESEKLLSKIHRSKRSNEVYLVNINRYFKDYPSNKEKFFNGYSHIKAEIKSTRFDGIEFFCSSPVEVYKKSNNRLSFRGDEKLFNAFPVGTVPYEWIEHIDLDGDEYGYIPLFYCKFKGRIYWKKSLKKFLSFGYPYKSLDYYRESDVYREGQDPAGMKYRYIDQHISKK